MATELDIYDYRPQAMTDYLKTWGWHFNKKACEFAVSKMRKLNSATGKKEPIDALSKDRVDEVLTRNNVKLEHSKGYDYVYAANQCMADLYKSSIVDEKHLALYVKDMIDDPDLEGGNFLRHWYSDMVAKGEPIIWEDLLD